MKTSFKTPTFLTATALSALIACSGGKLLLPDTLAASNSLSQVIHTPSASNSRQTLPKSIPVIPASALTFSWDIPTFTAGTGERIVDITANKASFILNSGTKLQTDIGLLSINSTHHPALNGHTLLNDMPPESALTIQPDGTAIFTAWDLFDATWRGRQPQWEDKEEDGVILRIDDLADDDDSKPAKVSLTASTSVIDSARFLLDAEDQISFYWNGDLRYCYDFGRPVQDISLSDPSGQHHSTFQAGPGFTIRVSNGNESWITIWEASEEGRFQPAVELPEALMGTESLCISFGGETEDYVMAEQYYLTAQLDANDLAGLTRFPAGTETIEYHGDGTGAMLFWNAPNLGITRQPPDYPADAPVVHETSKTLQIIFPSGVLLEFPMQNGNPGGLSRLLVGNTTLFKAAPGTQWQAPAHITLLAGDPAPLPGNFNWPAYRDQALASGSSPPDWQSRWMRTRQTYSLADGQFQNVEVNGQEVTLRWHVNTPDGSGEFAWSFAPASKQIAGADLTGIATWVRLSGPGLIAAEHVSIDFPLLISPDDWQIEQSFRALYEDHLSPATAVHYPQSIWFGRNQSFAFRTGPGRTLLGLFERPTWATVDLRPESGRHKYRFSLPLSKGDVRTTTPLLWLSTPSGTADRITAANLWGNLYEAIRTDYLTQTGIRYTPPLPTVVWNQPLEDQVISALEYVRDTGTYPPAGQSWFDWNIQEQLPRAEAAGIRHLIIQPPWISDAEDPQLVASLHAPRDFMVSPLLGGKDGLKRLVDEAHQRNIQITLWYPSSFSLYSPLIAQNPERLTWKISGIPEDFGWGDIVSLDKYQPHRQYVLEKLNDLRQDVPFDGLWLDSWVGLAVPTNYAEPQPAPQLDQAISLLRAFTEMGLTQIAIEGLGPLARSDAYGDYESRTGEPKLSPEIVADVNRLRRHEYLLYNMGAGMYLTNDTLPMYHRILASGGLMNIANFDEIDILDEDNQAWLKQINHDYVQVREKMRYRQLLADTANNWLGTAWTQDNSNNLVIFAFAPFDLELGGNASVTDITTGHQTTTSVLPTQAWHTYLIAHHP